MGEILRLLVVKRDMPLDKIVVEAYNTKLGIHHPWMLRKVCNVVFKAVCSRETFVKSYIKEKQLVHNRDTPFTDEDAYKDWEQFS